MLTSLIASHEATCPQVLTYLTTRAAAGSDPDALHTLARNRALPPEAVDVLHEHIRAGGATVELLTDVLSRPGIAWADALALARHVPGGVAAGAHVFGGPFIHAWGPLSPGDLAAVIKHHDIARPLRARAARKLAPHSNGHLSSFLVLFDDYPDLAKTLDSHLEPGDTRTSSRAQHARYRARRQTFASSAYLERVPPAVLIDRCAGRAGMWARAIPNLHDWQCTDELAEAALASGLHVTDLTTIAGRGAFSTDVRCRALLLLAVATAGTELTTPYWHVAAARSGLELPADASPGWLEEYSQVEMSTTQLMAVSHHPNVTAAVLDNLLVQLEDLKLLWSSRWLSWMVNLATHPAASPEQHGRALAELATLARSDQNDGPRDVAASLHRALGDGPLRGQELAAHLPVKVALDADLGQLPGIRAATYAAVCAYAPTLSPGGFDALVALEGHFTGTLTELLASAAAIAR